MNTTVALVGAGMAGASCAARLGASGVDCVVFDKGRGPGGRMSSRRTDTGHRFDHGTPWFDARGEGFRAAVNDAIDAGAIRSSEQGYVGVNGMSALCKHLLHGVDVKLSTRIASIRRDGAWTLTDEAAAEHGPFDAVVIAIPPSQAAEVLQAVAPEVAQRLAEVRMLPRWTAMLGFAERLSTARSEYQLADAKLYRSATNTVGDAWIVQASEAWSLEHLERPAYQVLNELTKIAREALADAWRDPVFSSAHRWRFAFVDEPPGEPFIEASANGLYFCGDWCLGRTVEDAWTSGHAVAEQILKSHA